MLEAIRQRRSIRQFKEQATEAEDPSPPSSLPLSQIAFADKYGKGWRCPMEQRMMITADDVLELIDFLVTGVRLCVDEPKLYGNFRLVDAASQLLGFVFERDRLEDKQSLQHSLSRLQRVAV